VPMIKSIIIFYWIDEMITTVENSRIGEEVGI